MTSFNPYEPPQGRVDSGDDHKLPIPVRLARGLAIIGDVFMLTLPVFNMLGRRGPYETLDLVIFGSVLLLFSLSFMTLLLRVKPGWLFWVVVLFNGFVFAALMFFYMAPGKLPTVVNVGYLLAMGLVTANIVALSSTAVHVIRDIKGKEPDVSL